MSAGVVCDHQAAEVNEGQKNDNLPVCALSLAIYLEVYRVAVGDG